MAATPKKEVKKIVVMDESQEKLVAENKIVIRNIADSIAGLSTTGMDSVYGRVSKD